MLGINTKAYSGAFIGDLRDKAQSYYSAYPYHKPLKRFLMLRLEGWTQKNIFLCSQKSRRFQYSEPFKMFPQKFNSVWQTFT